MTADQIYLLRKSFEQVERHGEVAALVFYRRLFEIDPSLRLMFKSNIEDQSRKLMEMLGLALSLAERAGALERELMDSGARHSSYGVREEHYDTLGSAMIDMLAEVLGSAFTPATRDAWLAFFTYAAETMQRGAVAIGPVGSSVRPAVHRSQWSK
jgi:hemoglobin-like flavoprotein